MVVHLLYKFDSVSICPFVEHMFAIELLKT